MLMGRVSVSFRCRRFRRVGTLGAVTHAVADALSAFQIPAAKNAAHGDGVNEVCVGWAFVVGAGFGHHAGSASLARRNEAS